MANRSLPSDDSTTCVNEVASRILKRRLDLGLSRRQAVELLKENGVEITGSGLHAWENGIVDFRLSQIEGIAAAYGCEIANIWPVVVPKATAKAARVEAARDILNKLQSMVA